VIAAAVVSFSLLLARLGTFLSVVPLFGGRNTPRTVKIGLAFALAVFWFDPAATVADPGLARSDISWPAFGMALGREALLGMILGYTLGLLLVPARVAGEFITQQMGLTLGNIIDPASESSTGAITQILEMLAILLFFGLDGHHVFLAVFHGTLARWPLGGPIRIPPITELIAAGSAAEESGLLLAAPLGAILFLTTVILALMARASPQMNIFSVGFALQISAGLVGALLLLPDLLRALVHTFERFSADLLRLV
jgi:flagellar biosynthetic protein FliR